MSVFLVTTITYTLIYTLIPRRIVFQDDVTYGKLKSKPDELKAYENTAFRNLGYIDYYDSASLVAKVKEDYPEVTGEVTDQNTVIFQKWATDNGWTLNQLPISKAYYAEKEIPILNRVLRFYGNMFELDHPWKVQDPENPDLERSIKIQNDELAGWSLVGSGTQHKYLIYFNSEFPYIHQNIITMNLGTSYPTFAGLPVLDVVAGGQGRTVSEEITFEDGTTRKTAANIYTRQYQPTSTLTANDKRMYDDNYARTQNNYRDPSMIGLSFRMGFIGVLIAYGIGIPMAMFMARLKNKWPDKLGIGLVTVLISVPSLAFVYFFRYVGSTFLNLPDSFPTLGASNIKSYILPTVILGLLSVSGLVIWVRRYMIDQQSADYVKFAKAKGLSSREISRKHIFKNAIIPIVNGIPASIIGAITGATITETVFAAPGMGKMLPDAIKAHNNPVVVAIVFVFTTVAVASVLMGDLTMAMVDPRINLSEKGE